MEIESVSQPVSQTVRQITRIRSKPPRKKRYNNIHNFKRTFNLGTDTFSTDSINPLLIAINFSMNDMPGYTELTSLYDFYRLRAVKVKVIPYFQTMSNSVLSTNNARNVPIFYAVDRSDSNAPSTVDEVLEYNDHKISNLYNGFSCYIPNPKFADATSAVRGGWVATTNATLNYFGLKVSMPSPGQAVKCYIVLTYYVQCKDPK